MTLTELIDSEPANAGRTDAEVLAWLYETVSRFRDIVWLDFQMWRHQEGVHSPLLEAIVADSGATAARRTAAQFFLDVASAGQPLAASDTRVQQLIVDANLPAQMRQALQDLAMEQVPRYALADFGTPGLGDVEQARA